MKLIEWIMSLFAPKVEHKRSENGAMRLSADGCKLLKYYEGCELTSYRDSGGVWTVGYGDTGPDVVEGLTITSAEAERRLANRLRNEFELGVLAALTAKPSQCQFDACVSLAYNVGVSAFTRSTLVRKFNEGDTLGAADQFLLWTKAGGKSLKGLRRRRAAERALFLGDPIDKALRIGNSHG